MSNGIAFRCVYTLRAVQLQSSSGGSRTTVCIAHQMVDLNFVTVTRIVARYIILHRQNRVLDKLTRKDRISHASWKIGRRARSRLFNAVIRFIRSITVIGQYVLLRYMPVYGMSFSASPTDIRSLDHEKVVFLKRTFKYIGKNIRMVGYHVGTYVSRSD